VALLAFRLKGLFAKQTSLKASRFGYRELPLLAISGTVLVMLKAKIITFDVKLA